jgi:hypothetical protein
MEGGGVVELAALGLNPWADTAMKSDAAIDQGRAIIRRSSF